MIKKSCDFVRDDPSLQAIILSSLVAMNIVEIEI